MQKIYSGKQLPTLYKQAEEIDNLTPSDHIDRAGQAFEREFARRYSPGENAIYVFAGADRAGAYSLALAHRLARRGRYVYTYLFHRAGSISEECEEVKKRIDSEAIRLEEIFTDFRPPRIEPTDFVIDGLFGAELQVPLSGGYIDLVDFINSTRATIISVELPSGLFAEDNSGNNLDHVIRAQWTIAFDAPKLAFFLSENAPYIGSWSWHPLGISPLAQRDIPATYYQIQDVSLVESLRSHPRSVESLRDERILLIAPGTGYAGKSLLTTRAATHAGCAEVHLLAPEQEALPLQLAQPELIVHGSSDHSFPIDEWLKSYRGIIVSEGFGTDRAAADRLEALMVASSSRPLLLDGDANKLLISQPKLLEQLPPNSILLLSAAEFDQLMQPSRYDSERLELALELARKVNAYLILRSKYTAICTPQGNIFFDASGNEGLVTHGVSSVLVGVIASLLGQGYQAITASVLGVHLVGLAAEIYAGRYSSRSLTASALIPLLGVAYHQLDID